MMITPVSRLEAITPEWLTQVLQSNGLLTENAVTAVDAELIGTGKMGDNARLHLTYDSGCSAPATLVAKIPAGEETARTMASGTGAYKKEVSFYRDLSSLTQMRTPKIYHADIDQQGAEFVLIMQDLSPAMPGSQFVGESPERCIRAVTEAAKLHAAFHNKEDALSQDYVTQNDEDGATRGEQLLQQTWPGFVDRFGHGLARSSISLGSHLVENYKQWAQRFDGETTLIHGDFRTENLLFPEVGAPFTVDWQTIQRSSPLADVAYFMGGSVDSDVRRECEEKVVEAYRVELDKQGLPISFRSCWEQYREFSLHGMLLTVLGAMFSEAGERSDRMFLVMIQRHLQHALDMQAEEFIAQR